MSITAEKIARAKALGVQIGSDAWVRAEYERLSKLEAAALLQQGEPEGALRRAYNKIEQHMFDYTHETHSYDASTNAWECSNGEVVAYVEGLDKALEIIKPMLSASPLPPAPGAETEVPMSNDNAAIIEQVNKQFSSSRQSVLEEAAKLVEQHAALWQTRGARSGKHWPQDAEKIASAIRTLAVPIRALATTPPAEGKRK